MVLPITILSILPMANVYIENKNTIIAPNRRHGEKNYIFATSMIVLLVPKRLQY